jgi:uncharacterized protein (DUF427 family)
MAKAIWNGEVIAERTNTVIIEGNHYFPPQSVRKDLIEESRHQTVCPWIGKASYYHVEVNGETKENAAWTYPHPKSATSQFKDYVAFWRGIEIQE